MVMFEPEKPCRVMPTRGCPILREAGCPDNPCARFESEDEAPWAADIAKWKTECLSFGPAGDFLYLAPVPEPISPPERDDTGEWIATLHMPEVYPPVARRWPVDPTTGR